MKITEFHGGQVLWVVHGLAVEAYKPVVRRVMITRVTKSSVTYELGTSRAGTLAWRAQSQSRFDCFFETERLAWEYVLQYRLRSWATLNARYRRATKHIHALIEGLPVGDVKVPKAYAKVPKI